MNYVSVSMYVQFKAKQRVFSEDEKWIMKH